MSRKNIIVSTILYLSLLILGTSPAQAVTPPSFPSCLNPQGVTKVIYTDGVHGIPGSSAEYRGSDAVYQVSDTQLTQCFCSENGDGIQTNWWKISSLPDEDVNVLKNLGWIFIPTGAIWGLDDDPYMAFNSTYACKTTTTTTTTTSSSDGGGQSGTSISPAEVLGLATMGNIIYLYSFVALGSLFLLLGLILRRSKR